MVAAKEALLRFLRWLVPLECLQQPRFWRMALFPILNMLILFLVIYISLPPLGYFTLPTEVLMGPHYKSMGYRLLMAVTPVILPIALLMRLLDMQGAPFKLAFSWPAFVLSEASLLFALWHSQPRADNAAILAAAFSCIAAFFIYVPFRECLSRLRRQQVPALVALVASACPALYIWFGIALWKATAGGTILLVSSLIRLTGADVTVSFGDEYIARYKLWDTYAILSSDFFSIKIFTPCSGMEGIMLFFYVMSLFLLADWPFLSRRVKLLETSLIGIFVLLLCNAMRIATIFVYASWLGSHGMGADAQRALVYMMHDNIGWTIDSAVIILFLLHLYRKEEKVA